MSDAVFAIPGDLTQRTGGYIYEATVLRELNALGCATQLLPLPGSFPNPTGADMDMTLEALAAVPEDKVLILDGFLVGALDPNRMGSIKAPMLGIVHHPLGLETGLDPDRAAFLRTNETAMLRHMAHVIVPSPHTREMLITQFEVGADLITVALPGIRRPEKWTAKPMDPPLILAVGIQAPRKGHDVLLQALSQVQDLVWTAQIVGKAHDATYAQNLLDLRQDLGLIDRVTFRGELDSAALNAAYQAAHLFALASHYEGYGMVLSEAIAHGLPVVSCNAGAIPDTVGEAGLFAPPGDPQAFACCLRQALSDPDTHALLSHAARVQAINLPTWSDTARIFAAEVKRLKETVA